MKHWICFAFIFALCGVFAKEPVIKYSEKTIDRKGVKLVRKMWDVDFHHSKLNFRNTLTPEGQLAKGAWDDLFLGLSHGTINNGSWDGWNFINIRSVKSKSLPEGEPVSKVDFVRFSDSSSLHLNWPSGQLRVLQQANNSKWMYAKVVIPDGIRSVTLRVRPGGAHYNIKGRERIIHYNGNEYNSVNGKRNVLPMAKGVDGMAFFSRNYNEKFGNFLIFESDKVAKMDHHSENPIYITFYPAPGVKEMCFGLSYFSNEDAVDAAKRFLVERLPTAKKAMDSIQWDKTPDFSEFKRNAAQVKTLINGLSGDAKAKFEKEFIAVNQACKIANQKKDVSAYNDALAKLRKLQQNVGTYAMNLLK